VDGCGYEYRHETGRRRHLLFKHHARIAGGVLHFLEPAELERRLAAGARGRMSGPQRRRLAENLAGSENNVLARAATSTADDVDLKKWPILDAWDTILANQSTYDRTAAVTQTESVITCDRATGEPPLTAEVNIQASVKGRHAGTQTEADYIDGYTGLLPGMSLRAVARTVREMATASTAQIVGRLVREYGGVAEAQRRELLLTPNDKSRGSCNNKPWSWRGRRQQKDLDVSKHSCTLSISSANVQPMTTRDQQCCIFRRL